MPVVVHISAHGVNNRHFARFYFRLLSGQSHFIDGREEKAHEDRNDHDNDEQLDKGEAAGALLGRTEDIHRRDKGQNLLWKLLANARDANEKWIVQTAIHFEEQTILSSEGARLFLKSPEMRGAIVAEAVFTHGLGEHSDRYHPVVAALAEKGVRLWVYDLRGHGRSSGRRGDIARYELFLDDLQGVVQVAAKSKRPLFLMGHSMGAQITLSYLYRRPLPLHFCGAVAASPWLRLAFEPACWRLVIGRVVSTIFPAFTQRMDENAEKLSRDPDHLRTLPGRSLMHRRISTRLFFGVKAAGEEALQHAPEICAPLLLIHGDDDHVTSLPATQEFFERAASSDKRLSIYQGARHETHNDLCRDAVIGEIGRWMTERAPSGEIAGC